LADRSIGPLLSTFYSIVPPGGAPTQLVHETNRTCPQKIVADATGVYFIDSCGPFPGVDGGSIRTPSASGGPARVLYTNPDSGNGAMKGLALDADFIYFGQSGRTRSIE
jgi:hypothetical protein